MIGDTNLFFSNSDTNIVAEAEIMIAETWARGCRCGWNAMLIMLLYGINYLNVKEYVAKISLQNLISLKFFLNLGFKEIAVSTVFGEVTMAREVDDIWIQSLKQQAGPFEVIEDNAFKLQ